MENLNISPFSMMSLIVPFIMTAISIYYASKRFNTEAILLTAGSILVFVTAVFAVFMPYLIWSRHMPMDEVSLYYGVLGTITFIGNLLFAIGFFMLVLTVIRKNEAGAAKKL
ncbi:hypothetical protein [Chryseobacterium gregarium]|uniref:hypothetical protein n=1 Tax=Chryseobacterium gregarium TaxID=456299 RepID=UPI00040930BA|nr:hypothetical protein [Chryseobacterium gregarium]